METSAIFRAERGNMIILHFREFFTPHNVALSKLLTKLRTNIPGWLEDELTRPES